MKCETLEQSNTKRKQVKYGLEQEIKSTVITTELRLKPTTGTRLGTRLGPKTNLAKSTEKEKTGETNRRTPCGQRMAVEERARSVLGFFSCSLDPFPCTREELAAHLRSLTGACLISNLRSRLNHSHRPPPSRRSSLHRAPPRPVGALRSFCCCVPQRAQQPLLCWGGRLPLLPCSLHKRRTALPPCCMHPRHLPKATPSPRAKLPCYCCAHQRVTPTRPPPNLRKNISKRKNKGRTKRDSGMNQIKNAEVTRREEPPFPINSWNKISQIHLKSLTLEKKRGEERK